MRRMNSGEVRGGRVQVNGVMQRDPAHDAVIAGIMERAYGRRYVREVVDGFEEPVRETVTKAGELVDPGIFAPAADPVVKKQAVREVMDDEAVIAIASAAVAVTVMAGIGDVVAVAKTRPYTPLRAWYGPADGVQQIVLNTGPAVDSFGECHYPSRALFVDAAVEPPDDRRLYCDMPPELCSDTWAVVATPGAPIPPMPDDMRRKVTMELTVLVKWWFAQVVTPLYERLVDRAGVAANAHRWYGPGVVDITRDQTCFIGVFRAEMRAGMHAVAKWVPSPGKDPDWMFTVAHFMAWASTLAVAAQYVLPWDWYVREAIQRRRYELTHLPDGPCGYRGLVRWQFWPRAFDALTNDSSLRDVMSLDPEYLLLDTGVSLQLCRHEGVFALFVVEQNAIDYDDGTEYYRFSFGLPPELYDLIVRTRGSEM